MIVEPGLRLWPSDSFIIYCIFFDQTFLWLVAGLSNARHLATVFIHLGFHLSYHGGRTGFICGFHGGRWQLNRKSHNFRSTEAATCPCEKQGKLLTCIVCDLSIRRLPLASLHIDSRSTMPTWMGLCDPDFKTKSQIETSGLDQFDGSSHLEKITHSLEISNFS